ncbi:AAA family ATPase [Corallococcus carmarthensis]|uniref:MoxR family ATPase n=1 Tax=Corallococcus carmarthensis TaxID=2316728 RepID=A0A3A8JNK1_9BACT|nr:MoxR family ATPase [Corallococcus carmarthensis]RKG97357.1 MoxR family ATPase [Corallococcus carmarthensis]
MNSKLNFDPKLFNPLRPPSPKKGRSQTAAPPATGAGVYVYSSDIILAVNTALATERPLLVMGPPGTGKSSLAKNVAQHLGWRFYQKVVTSRTQAQDLLWTFDALRRLRDAQTAALKQGKDAAYVQPGVLWWAFDPDSAKHRGGKPSPRGPFALDPSGSAGGPNAVVLLDEIDKADPDVPNDLLGPLGDGTFEVTDIGQVITRQAQRQVLLVITSNDERELSPAFVRRCILLTLKAHDRDRLVEIACKHSDEQGKQDVDLYREIANRVVEDREAAEAAGERPPSTAEFLDTVKACRQLGLRPSSPTWDELSALALSKFRTSSPPPPPRDF